MSGEIGAYLGLFASAFLAATLIPAQSESVLVYLTVTGKYSVVLLVAFASLGNILGSIVNWYLGRGVEHYRNRRWFPLTPEKLEKAQGWYARYGRWSLLASWVPIIGDPLTVVAGVMREPLASFIAIVAIAKIGRYAVLALATIGLF
ncbi:YqaA family protein [Agrobacterium larrymoorei]|uniref:DedA family protein n=1 Tax=Agrobacterium larrymoorei TaxID=160699 RepID=A0A4D7DQL8_9HYPH|nr:YqaA family protein [Agrobacterium larrymoorei]QCI98007.1 DedA family protein [Agrobacterium larrymoorei]QYA06541.1 DedA family protein [Agrobacterium larrymoorei]